MQEQREAILKFYAYLIFITLKAPIDGQTPDVNIIGLPPCAKRIEPIFSLILKYNISRIPYMDNA